MSIEQVNLDIMNVNLTINTPTEEKDTLIQAVEMLNKKSEAIKESGRIVGTDKIIVMAALNVVHDLLKVSLKDDLAIGEFQRKITDMSNACQKALSRLEQNWFSFPCSVREGIYSFEPISSLQVAGSSSERDRLLQMNPKLPEVTALSDKVQADSAETAYAGIPISSHTSTYLDGMAFSIPYLIAEKQQNFDQKTFIAVLLKQLLSYRLNTIDKRHYRI